MPDQTNVTTNTPQTPSPMGGAPTTTSNVDGAITPVTTTAQPTAPSPTPTPQPSQPIQRPQAQVGGAQVGGAGTTRTASSPSMHARIFDKILRTMGGGAIKVVNPDGTVSDVMPSRSTLGKSIVAAALTGLMTPNHYRQTPYGPAPDMSADASAAFSAGKQTMENIRNKPQQLSDEQQARRLQFLKNNATLMQLQLASAHAKHENWEQQQKDAAPFLESLHQYDDARPADDPNSPRAILVDGLTHEEAFEWAKRQGTGFTEANYIPDGGWKSGIDPETGKEEMEPTYAVINPALSKLKVTPDIAKKLATVDSRFAGITDKVDGDVNIPQSLWVRAWHDYSNLQRVNESLSRLNGSLGNKGDIDVSPLVRANRRLIPELGTVVTALAAGNGTGEGENPANVLDVLLKNAPELLKPLGLTTQQASDKVLELTAKRTATLAAAKNTGTPKMLADPEAVKGMVDAVKQLPENQQKSLLPTLEAPNVTKQDLDKVQTKLGEFQRANQQNDTRKAIENGDPQVIAQTAASILDGAFANVKDLASYRGTAREALQNAVLQEAQRRGLDVSRWGQAALQSKVDMYTQYHSTDRNKVGAQLSAFRVFLDHADDALQANETWKRGNSPLLNKPLSWIAENATNDPNWVRYKESFLPVAKEFMNFLNQNRAEHEADIQQMDKILNLSYTPLEAETAIKSLAMSADKRLADLAYAYNSNMGTTMPEMLTADAADTLKRMGEPSKALRVIQRLPQGNGQPITPATAKVFLQVAGGDSSLGMEMAKQAGWR